MQIRTASVPSQRRPENDAAALKSSRKSFEEHRIGGLDKRSVSEDGYSPMAAAFVRAARRVHFVDGEADKENRGRYESGRSRLELEARLFDGPA